MRLDLVENESMADTRMAVTGYTSMRHADEEGLCGDG